MSIWEFQKKTKKMGNDTRIFDKVLPQSGFTDEELLARESIQNCKDAAVRENGIPQQSFIKITRKSLNGENKRNLIEALLLKKQASYFNLVNDPHRSAGMSDFLENEDSLETLTIEDSGTVGLGGNWQGNGDDDNFSHLVINIAKCGKKGGDYGGSFGFGKTVYPKASKLRFVLYYSKFDPVEENGETVNARFMALWLLKPDLDNGFTGFAFFGENDPEDPGTSKPLTNQAAHDIAQKCGMQPRTENGTSICIVDCSIDLKRLKDAIERYWWSSIHDEKITVKLFDCDQEIEISPVENPIVEPYWKIYDGMEVGHGILPENCTKKTFDSVAGMRRGTLCYMPMSEALIDASKKYQESIGIPNDEIIIGGIARIRSAGMVLKYDVTGINPDRPLVALFKADHGIDNILRSSEPQTHDYWDHHATSRITSFAIESNIDPSTAIRVVRSTNDTLNRYISEATRKLLPPPPPPVYRLKKIESLLSKLMNSGNSKPVSTPRPFSMKLKTIKSIDNGARKDEVNIELQLKENQPATQVLVKVDCTVITDTNGSVGGRIPCNLTDLPNNNIINGDLALPPEILITLQPGSKYKLKATSYPGSNDVIRFTSTAINPE
jgi:hypothetical protein